MIEFAAYSGQAKFRYLDIAPSFYDLLVGLNSQAEA